MSKLKVGDKVRVFGHYYRGIDDIGEIVQKREKREGTTKRWYVVMIQDSNDGEKYTLNFMEDWLEKIEETRLRVAHYPQIPCKPFHVDVKDLEDASRIRNLLANHDLFQFHENIKPDNCSVILLEQWDEEEGDWVDWYDEETGIDDLEEYLEFIKECEQDEE